MIFLNIIYNDILRTLYNDILRTLYNDILRTLYNDISDSYTGILKCILHPFMISDI